uniref:CHK domain-containing protein n=1 Tax=Panagrellus redivivus TaxID=6233 RepID=A0A7E4UZQ2_PANRE
MGCGSSSTANSVADGYPSTTSTSKTQLGSVDLGPAGFNKYTNDMARLSVADSVATSSMAGGWISPLNEGDTKEHEDLQFICNTDVTLEWLYQRITEKFKCPNEPEPQWIAERLNTISDKDLDQTTVLRVTFGWENEEEEKLPKSIILKICVQQSQDVTDDMKLAQRMFLKECNVYEWLSKQKKIVVPQIYVIKKHPTEAGNGVIIMEDMAEHGHAGQLAEGLSVEAVRGLLQIFAQIHATSMKTDKWTTMIAPNSPFFYKQTVQFAKTTLDNWPDFDPNKIQMFSKFLTQEYLSNTESETCEQLNVPQCLVHGNPAPNSCFFNGNEQVEAIIDWTHTHPGCYAEDVAKAICWNLSPQQRHEQLIRLLEHYHFHLIKNLGSPNDALDIDQVKKAYNIFLPVAAVKFLLFLPEKLEDHDAAIMERATSLITDALVVSSQTHQEEKPEVKQSDSRRESQQLSHRILT